MQLSQMVIWLVLRAGVVSHRVDSMGRCRAVVDTLLITAQHAKLFLEP